MNWDDPFGPYKECPFCVERGLEPLVKTPRWKIRRHNGLWRVEEWRGVGSFWLLVGEYRLWENALAHTEIP